MGVQVPPRTQDHRRVLAGQALAEVVSGGQKWPSDHKLITTGAATVPTEPQGMPSPPFPDPHSELLRLVIKNSIESYRSGEATAEQAIMHAAVHGWYEGHINGEDACPGCSYRGSEGVPRPGVADRN